jgi:hypothetical protein
MAGYATLAEVVKALVVANAFLETDLEELKAAVSMGTRVESCLMSRRRCRVIGRVGMIEV